MSEFIAPEAVREKFGPPSYLETLLSDIGEGKGKIDEALTNFLTLPYVNSIKVTNRAGAEVSLYDQVKVLKDKYENIQSRSIPIVQELSAYARLSQLLLPNVATPNGLTLDEFLTTNTPLVIKYGQEAKILAKETDALRDEFKELLGVLEHNLAEVLKQIDEQQHALEEAEKEYQFEKVTAIISGIMTLGFLIGAVVALCVGAYPVAAELGVHAGLALYETIKSAIKANGLAKVIVNLKAAIETSKETKNSLEVLIPAFKDISEMLQKIGNAWDSISEGLADVKDNYVSWSNPKLFTKEMLAETMDAWKRVIDAVDVYIIVITGADANPVFENSSKQFTTNLSVNAWNESTMDYGAESDQIEIESVPPAYELIKNEMDTTAIRSIFTAPVTRGRLLQPSEMITLINEYRNNYQQLCHVGQTDVAEKCGQIARYIEGFVMPAVFEATRELRAFASDQPDIEFALAGQTQWMLFCDIRMQAIQRGRDLVRIAYNNIHDTNCQATDLDNLLIARIQELRITGERIKQELHRFIIDRNHQEQQLMRTPYARVLKIIIDKLTNNIRQLETDCYEIESRIDQINDTMRVADLSRQRLTALSELHKNLESIYNGLLTDMTCASTMWPVFHKLSLRPAEITVFKATWDSVRAMLGEWGS